MKFIDININILAIGEANNDSEYSFGKGSLFEQNYRIIFRIAYENLAFNVENPWFDFSPVWISSFCLR